MPIEPDPIDFEDMPVGISAEREMEKAQYRFLRRRNLAVLERMTAKAKKRPKKAA